MAHSLIDVAISKSTKERAATVRSKAAESAQIHSGKPTALNIDYSVGKA